MAGCETTEPGAVVVSPTTVFRAVLLSGVKSTLRKFGGTDGLPGSWTLTRFYVWLPTLTDLGKSILLDVALASDVPTTVADMDAAEILFPFLFSGSASTRALTFNSSNGVAEIAGRFPIAPKGRRIVAMANTLETGPLDVSLGFVLERT